MAELEGLKAVDCVETLPLELLLDERDHVAKVE